MVELLKIMIRNSLTLKILCVRILPFQGSFEELAS